MTMLMMMEEDEEIEHVFVAHEIDLDYEFDAPRFFDFTRPETLSEAHQAQLWFQNAASHPPSPFVARLAVREDFLLDDVSDSPKSKQMECSEDYEKPSVPLGMQFSQTGFDNDDSKTLGGKIPGLLGGILQNDDMQPLQLPTGLTFSSNTVSDKLISKAKSTVAKSSTLLKPTASQLAKHNRPPQNVGSRFPKLLAQNERNISTSYGLESQAAKRQKLDGGLLCKAIDVKQQTNFVHKAPHRSATSEQNSVYPKLKLTIPREPDLKTAHRAQRIRPKNAPETEHVAAVAPRFKARPLNKKILDAPSLPLPKRSTPRLPEFQEFHLKTWERAMQHTSATSSSSLHCNDSDKGWDNRMPVSAVENRIKDWRRPIATSTAKHDGLDFTHNFKARPLNKKIFTSKGNIGVFRNSKQETAVPMEFNFDTEKGVQYNPPIELFGKMSLTSEVQPNNGSHWKLPQHSGMFKQEKPFMFGAKQVHSGNGGCINEAGAMLSARRSLGIR